MNSDIIQILRKPKLVINDEISIAVFDITATFIPIYIVSKYMLGLNSPILVIAFATVPLGYFLINILRLKLHLEITLIN